MTHQPTDTLTSATANRLSQTQSLALREISNVLNGLSALECVTDSARQNSDAGSIADALEFIVEHLYQHVGVVNDSIHGIQIKAVK